MAEWGLRRRADCAAEGKYMGATTTTKLDKKKRFFGRSGEVDQIVVTSKHLA